MNVVTDGSFCPVLDDDALELTHHRSDYQIFVQRFHIREEKEFGGRGGEREKGGVEP